MMPGLTAFFIKEKCIVIWVVSIQLCGCAMSSLSTDSKTTPGGTVTEQSCNAACAEKTATLDGTEKCLKFSSGMADVCSKLTNTKNESSNQTKTPTQNITITVNQNNSAKPKLELNQKVNQQKVSNSTSNPDFTSIPPTTVIEKPTGAFTEENPR